MNILKKARNIFFQILTTKTFLFVSFLILVLLLLKNPYSERTLIPNLEPYPDTIHYINSAQSLLKGYGLFITRNSKTIVSRVTPLYSLILVPFYLFNKDPRNFYFANVLLSLSSLFIFYQILKKVTDNKWLIGLTLFLYVTNYYIYWYPSWAMAENLLLTLFLLALYIFTLEINSKRLILAGIVGISIYATKYAAGPLASFFLGIYGLKIILESKKWKEKLRNLAVFIFSVGISFAAILLVESQIGHTHEFSWLINSVVGTRKELTVVSGQNLVSTQGGWFSMGYFLNNFKAYFSALRGGSIRFIWDFRPIFPIWLGNFGLLGLLIALFSKKLRFLSLALAILLFGEIVVISLFYAQDARFIIYAVPVTLLGFTLFLEILRGLLSRTKIKNLFLIIIIFILAFYSWGNILRLKNQIMLNLRHAEIPWSYVAVLKMNEYFQEDKIVDDKKPFVITPMIPHYIDFYSNGNYNLLPLSDQQAFFKEAKDVWGDYDYSNLKNLYNKLLKEGNSLYFAKYGLGNETYLHAEWESMMKKFRTTKVYEGCYTQCDIYKIELRKNN